MSRHRNVRLTTAELYALVEALPPGRPHLFVDLEPRAGSVSLNEHPHFVVFFRDPESGDVIRRMRLFRDGVVEPA